MESIIVDTSTTGTDESVIKDKAKRLVEERHRNTKIATPIGVTLHERSATVTYVLQDAGAQPGSNSK